MVRVTGWAAPMGAIVVGVLLIAVAEVHASSWRRSLEEEVGFEKRHLFSCKNENDACSGVPGCCGDLQCYWVDGYSPFRRGKCVMCIESGLACQRDSSCCGDLQCDKLDLLDINGVCKQPRTSGACYRNSQCMYKCEKAYYKGQGHCTD